MYTGVRDPMPPLKNKKMISNFKDEKEEDYKDGWKYIQWMLYGTIVILVGALVSIATAVI